MAAAKGVAHANLHARASKARVDSAIFGPGSRPKLPGGPEGRLRFVLTRFRRRACSAIRHQMIAAFATIGASKAKQKPCNKQEHD
jgi:hypothetical protein